MKKKNVINLIKYYAENNDSGFRSEAYEIAKDFDQIGDYQLAEYIMALMSNANTFVPQMNENESSMFEKVEKNGDPLWLPEDIMQDVLGIVHAVAHNAGINKCPLGISKRIAVVSKIHEKSLWKLNPSGSVHSLHIILINIYGGFFGNHR